ncbi:hypothetical protein VTI28DRAFT_10358 [Corynascus sepedonium]
MPLGATFGRTGTLTLHHSELMKQFSGFWLPRFPSSCVPEEVALLCVIVPSNHSTNLPIEGVPLSIPTYYLTLATLSILVICPSLFIRTHHNSNAA